MLTLNLEFQEEYKRLNRLCKDYLASSEGISEYIRQMESTSWSDRRYIFTWEDDYKQLKHVRWIRNRLAHEVGTLYSDICTESDLYWVQNFHSRIISGSDPFSVIRRSKAEVALQAMQREQEPMVADHPKLTSPIQTNSKSSFWNGLIEKFKKIFS